jgi:anion-transporting  ArsA/GET3 family ATPase
VDPGLFCAQARLFIVAGKGGVGKTTVSAALARMAARRGLSSLVVEVEGKSGLGSAFGHSETLTYNETILAGGGGADGAADVRARTVTPDDALLEYLQDHGMRRISRRLVATGALDVVATAAPGIKDILVLGKVKQLERAAAAGAPDAAEFVVLDGPAAGHAVTFLMSAHGLLDAVTVGPIRAQAAEVIALLSDPERCQVMLVTLPEETPVNEMVETAYALEDRVGLKLSPVVVNGMYPTIDLDVDPIEAASRAEVHLSTAEVDSLRRAAEFRCERQRLQTEQVKRLADALPLPQLHLPFLFTTELGPSEVDILSTALASEIRKLRDPDVAPSTQARRPAGPVRPAGR